MNMAKATGKPKKRGSEKRKEKSRDAARCRRSKEADIFASLVAQLPQSCITTAPHGQIDKATIMRLALSMLKLHDLVDCSDDRNSDLIVDCLFASNGFLMIVAKDGEIIFVSENVMTIIGIPQVDLIGHSLYDFAHPCEQTEIHDLLVEKPVTDSSFRMKSTLTQKGRSVNLKSALYKVIHCHGHHIPPKKPPMAATLILHCEALPMLCSNSELFSKPSSKIFITHHTMSMKIVYCDQHVDSLIGFQPSELTDKSMFELYHAGDGEHMAAAFKKLINLGQVRTPPYRLLASSGGYVWTITWASLVQDDARGKPTGVVCQHHVISDVIDSNKILSAIQLKPVKAETCPVFSTEKVFCSFSEMTAEEMKSLSTAKFDVDSDKLIHLAPDAGDTCVPLDFPDMPDLEMIEPSDITCERASEVLDVDYYPSPPVKGPVVTPIKWEPLSVETPDSSPSPNRSAASSVSPNMSPNYPPSEGFSGNDSVMTSPYSSGMGSPFKDPGFTKFSPLFDGNERLDDTSLEMRAPYIPMDDDWMLTWDNFSRSNYSSNSRLDTGMKSQFLNDFLDPMLTSACNPLPDPVLTPAQQSSVAKRKLDTSPIKSEYVSSCYGSRAPQKPVPSSCTAEPPQTKVARSDIILPKLKEPPKKPAQNSVLMNLLTCGEDRNYGYSCASGKKILESLPRITQLDAEVNAPIRQPDMLTGQQLLDALDMDSMDSVVMIE